MKTVALKKLELKDKTIINDYLSLEEHKLSNFSFANIFIWKSLFEISREIINGALCLFFKDQVGCFMYLPPIGNQIKEKTVKECFDVMDGFNRNKSVSRIENVEENDIRLYVSFGLKYKLKGAEYIYKNDDLINLSGNKYKGKRSGYNYCLDNYACDYLEYSPSMKEDCLKLYNEWRANRKRKSTDSIYEQMLDDGFLVHELSMEHYDELGLVARIVKIDGQIKAYTFGCKLNDNFFCVLHEIADLDIKGLSAFIFRRFCAEHCHFKYINAMDDSGLENIKKVKLSYHPYKLENSYIISN